VEPAVSSRKGSRRARAWVIQDRIALVSLGGRLDGTAIRFLSRQESLLFVDVRDEGLELIRVCLSERLVLMDMGLPKVADGAASSDTNTIESKSHKNGKGVWEAKRNQTIH
jgi:hypothetical protein